jgi:hypothetical protein
MTQRAWPTLESERHCKRDNSTNPTRRRPRCGHQPSNRGMCADTSLRFTLSASAFGYCLVNLQGLAPSNARMRRPRPAERDIVFTVKEIGCLQLAASSYSALRSKNPSDPLRPQIRDASLGSLNVFKISVAVKRQPKKSGEAIQATGLRERRVHTCIPWVQGHGLEAVMLLQHRTSPLWMKLVYVSHAVCIAKTCLPNTAQISLTAELIALVSY